MDQGSICRGVHATYDTGTHQFELWTLDRIGLSIGQTNSILCFSDSAGHIITEFKKKNVKNAIKRVGVGDLYHMLVRMSSMRAAM